MIILEAIFFAAALYLVVTLGASLLVSILAEIGLAFDRYRQSLPREVVVNLRGPRGRWLLLSTCWAIARRTALIAFLLLAVTVPASEALARLFRR